LWSIPIIDDPATEGDVRPFADLQTPRALVPRSIYLVMTGG
jgi:hypothetical protein